MANKLLDFKASISDVKQINPLFSTCKIRIMYTGLNRNMSIITKKAVEQALPSLAGIPIVGEYSSEAKDFKGHGGSIDLDSYKYVHTTKPYGFVPESAEYSWEDVKGRDGMTREYLVIDGCYLWTGRYEEAYDVVLNGKGQSMEIEVTDGVWNESEEAYQVDSFIFSALCILGDDVEPAFEDSNIMAYSLDKDSFKAEFSTMLKELKESMSKDKEVNSMLKELLEKYSLNVEDLTAKGIDFNSISEEELEAKIIEVFEIEAEIVTEIVEEVEIKVEDEIATELETEIVKEEVVIETELEVEDEIVNEEVELLKARILELEAEKAQFEELEVEVQGLREFKLETEKAEHTAKAEKLFEDFQLTEEDVEGLDIHKFSVEEIEEKCFAILGRKLANKKNFAKDKDKDVNIRIDIQNEDNKGDEQPYGGLFAKYNKKD